MYYIYELNLQGNGFWNKEKEGLRGSVAGGGGPSKLSKLSAREATAWPVLARRPPGPPVPNEGLLMIPRRPRREPPRWGLRPLTLAPEPPITTTVPPWPACTVAEDPQVEPDPEERGPKPRVQRSSSANNFSS